MIIIGLGSNIGDRLAHLRGAVKCLSPLVAGMRLSSIVESPALLPPGAAEEWNLPFYNMALAGECSLNPPQLLAEIKAIEQRLGRAQRGHWGPREIDVDILCINDQVVQQQDLHIPHPELLNRDFALLPLCELAPEWIYPLPGIYEGMKAIDIAAAKGYGFDSTLQKTEHRIHG
jgi:2-amino-4-hydroxy-6-hydroxymethyldihydropteridine diphosphokinase/dihydropteroate synthase